MAIVVLAAFLVALCGQSCSFRSLEEVSPAKLSIHVRLPQQMLTRAAEGDINPYNAAERVVSQLQIWVFRHSDGALAAYFAPASNNLQSGSSETFSTYITDEFAQNNLAVDVYVLANANSIGLELSSSTTRAQLDAAVISGSWFGTSSPTTVNDILNTGLPMSCVRQSAITGSSLLFSIPEMTLTRAVSKVRFVFCQMTDGGETVDNYALTNIGLDAGMIPVSESVFTTADHSVSGSYVSGVTYFPVPSSSQIPGSDDPTQYIFDRANQTAQEYEDLINTAIAENELCESGPFYFRESDKKISGTVNYSVGGVNRTPVAFEMDAAGDFYRNHSWIVYCYFVGGKLMVKPVPMPWEAAHDRFDFSTEGSTEMNWIEYLRYDLDSLSSTWGDTWVACAPGLYATNRPRYSPQIEIHSHHGFELWLQVNNDKFYFVERTGDDENLQYTVLGQRIVIPAGEDVINYFFLVPEAGHYQDIYADVYITIIRTDGIPPYNIPFNHDLPGAEDHTTLRFCNVGANYAEYQNAVKIPGDKQESNFWKVTKN